jgi:excisionase family DNA binding protein
MAKAKAKYITIPQLAKMLGISRIAVYKKVKSGQIKATRIGKNYVISDKDISQILGGKLSDKDKKRIDKAVEKVVAEYGELLRMLGKN